MGPGYSRIRSPCCEQPDQKILTPVLGVPFPVPVSVPAFPFFPVALMSVLLLLTHHLKYVHVVALLNGQNKMGCPPAFDSYHIGSSYHLHSIHHVVSTLCVVGLKKITPKLKERKRAEERPLRSTIKVLAYAYLGLSFPP